MQFNSCNNRYEGFLSVLKSYGHVAVGITKIDKTIMGMLVNTVEIDAIDGKQYVLSKVCFVNISKVSSSYFV